jgi:hypothetical protein
LRDNCRDFSGGVAVEEERIEVCQGRELVREGTKVVGR